MDLETVIGLEVHVELATDTKIFCPCGVDFGGRPNTRVCPVCLGLPGSLPVLNRQAVAHAITAALALDCEVGGSSKFDRKNYNYPDLPKGYQISQYDRPLAGRGRVDVQPDADGQGKGEETGVFRVGIRRVHLEEDAGKSVHEGVAGASLVDYNRTGVPLIEIVSEPDMRSPEQARQYLVTLRDILRYTGVSDVKMEEGSLRCDANVSLRPRGSDEFGALTEVKNMNSFRGVRDALAYEVDRQRQLLEAGDEVTRETRHWDEDEGRTVSSRSKEEAHDYRYFPEPDLVPVEPAEEWVASLDKALPELPAVRRRRLIEEHDLPAYDVGVITESREMADFLDDTVDLHDDAKAVSNWLMGDLLAFMNENDADLDEVPVTPEHLAEMLDLLAEGVISSKIAKELFEAVCETGRPPAAIVEERGLKQVTDDDRLRQWVAEVIDEHPDVVEDIRGGKDQAIGYLVGQVMQASQGKANPQRVNELLREAVQEG